MRTLVGDIGGTKTELALFDRTELVDRARYDSRAFPSLDVIITRFLSGRGIDAGALAIAGPIHNGACKTTNLPWEITQADLSTRLRARITLLNDFAAVVLGIPQLDRERDLLVLARGEYDEQAPFAVIGAGTGLGEAVGVPFAGSVRVLSGEGGHADFAPRNDVEIELLRFLQARHGERVSVERAISGPGLAAIYDFVCEHAIAEPNAETRAALLAEADRPAVIGALGSRGEDPACTSAVDLFVALYGAEAGNLALKVLPTGGLYVAGGIAPKLAERISRGDFMQAFVSKGRMSEVLTRIPVAVVMNPDVALLGALAAVHL
jgi:glucokinase